MASNSTRLNRYVAEIEIDSTTKIFPTSRSHSSRSSKPRVVPCRKTIRRTIQEECLSAAKMYLEKLYAEQHGEVVYINRK